MKRKKIQLSEIKVKSFVTAFDKKQNGTIKGGAPTAVDCTVSSDTTITLDTNSPNAGCFVNGEESLMVNCAI